MSLKRPQTVWIKECEVNNAKRQKPIVKTKAQKKAIQMKIRKLRTRK